MGTRTYENPVECNNSLHVGTDAPENVYLWIGDDRGLSYYLPPDQVPNLIGQLQSWLSGYRHKHEGDSVQEYQTWTERYYAVVGEMPKTTFGEWRMRRIIASDILNLLPEAEAEEVTPMVLHSEDFFIDDSYTCKLCGYYTDSEEDFVEHVLDTHEAEARASNAVSISGAGRSEYWDVDSTALAEEFNAS